MRSAIYQTRARLAKRAAKRARDLPNVAHLVKYRAFDKLVKCAARLPKCADWSNAPYIYTMILACEFKLILIMA